MNQVLIISPHFPPVNAPDHQRLRMVLPHLEENGWRPTILAVHPDYVSAPRDDTLEKTIPHAPHPHFAHALGLTFAKIPGLGTLSGRAYPSLKKTGNRLLSLQHYDLIFFTTTQFAIFTLGPYWKKKWGVPFALDLQDPWINDFYRRHHTSPPGGWLKFNFQQFLSRKQAKHTIPQAAGLLSVSDAYHDFFRNQNMVTPDTECLTLPFPHSPADWKLATKNPRPLPWNPGAANTIHWIYAGRGGDDLLPCLAAFFQSLSQYIASAPPGLPNLHLWFIGTRYGIQNSNPQPIPNLARHYGLPQVHEIPERMPFLDTLYLLSKADGLIMPGSIDPRYQPSKLIPLLASGKPLLVAAPDHSPCAATLNSFAPGNLISYTLPIDHNSLTQTFLNYWNSHGLHLPETTSLTMKLSNQEASASTSTLCRFWERCLSHA